MEIYEFVTKMANQFADEDVTNVKLDTEFRKLETWDSLTGMAVLVMIQDDYGVALTVEEFTEVSTPNELFVLLQSKM